MLLNVLEIMGALWAYILVWVLAHKFADKVIDFDEPFAFFYGIFWPITVPLSALVFGIIGAWLLTDFVVEKVVESGIAMWEEWRA